MRTALYLIALAIRDNVGPVTEDMTTGIFVLFFIFITMDIVGLCRKGV